jgi:hypothetical protein
MGILSIIKHAGTILSINVQLCDKSWSRLNSAENLVLCFKSDKKLHKILNGNSRLLLWDFFTDGKKLVIYDVVTGGTSYNLKFLNEDALILSNEETKENEYFSNQGSKNPPKDIDEVFKQYVAKRVLFLNQNDISGTGIVRQTDIATEGLASEDLIHCINIFRKDVRDYNDAYMCYLYNYQIDHDPSFDKQLAWKAIVQNQYRTQMSYTTNIKSLNMYIKSLDDSVFKYYKVDINDNTTYFGRTLGQMMRLNMSFGGKGKIR